MFSRLGFSGDSNVFSPAPNSKCVSIVFARIFSRCEHFARTLAAAVDGDSYASRTTIMHIGQTVDNERSETFVFCSGAHFQANFRAPLSGTTFGTAFGLLKAITRVVSTACNCLKGAADDRIINQADYCVINVGQGINYAYVQNDIITGTYGGARTHTRMPTNT